MRAVQVIGSILACVICVAISNAQGSSEDVVLSQLSSVERTQYFERQRVQWSEEQSAKEDARRKHVARNAEAKKVVLRLYSRHIARVQGSRNIERAQAQEAARVAAENLRLAVESGAADPAQVEQLRQSATAAQAAAGNRFGGPLHPETMKSIRSLNDPRSILVALDHASYAAELRKHVDELVRAIGREKTSADATKDLAYIEAVLKPGLTLHAQSTGFPVTIENFEKEYSRAATASGTRRTMPTVKR